MKLIVLLLFCVVSNATPIINGGIVEIETNKIGNEATDSNPELTDAMTMTKIKEINVKCIEETGIDQNIINNVITNLTLPGDDEIYKKFLACSYKKQNYENDKGEIVYENIKRFLSNYYRIEDLKVLDVCGKLKQTNNAGQNAFNALKCILPKLVEIKEVRDE